MFGLLVVVSELAIAFRASLWENQRAQIDPALDRQKPLVSPP
jgi:hypothetical protein